MGSGNEGGGETEGVVKVDLVRRKMMMKTNGGGLWTRRGQTRRWRGIADGYTSSVPGAGEMGTVAPKVI